MEEFSVLTKSKWDLVNITQQVRNIVKKAKAKNGICNVFVRHTTCAILINENDDPKIMEDIQDLLKKLVPEKVWKHNCIDENGAAHIKTALLGVSHSIPVKDKKLMLGRWQGIMLADFDGPRQRKIIVTVAGE
jgi:secondary thiamine-phosphate synthase enzyme